MQPRSLHLHPTLTTTTSTSCYFSILPPTTTSSDDTPFASPIQASDLDVLPAIADTGNYNTAFTQSLRPSTLDRPLSPAGPSDLMQHPASPDSKGGRHNHNYHVTRPDPRPMQNVLHVTSDSSSSSSSASSSSSSPLAVSPLSSAGLPSLPEGLIRCSRCQRSPSLDIKTGQRNMVQYGLNSWYCTRCAAMVGYNPKR